MQIGTHYRDYDNHCHTAGRLMDVRITTLISSFNSVNLIQIGSPNMKGVMVIQSGHDSVLQITLNNVVLQRRQRFLILSTLFIGCGMDSVFIGAIDC